MIKRIFLCFISLVGIFTKVFSDSSLAPTAATSSGPWLAGPLIAPAGTVVPRGSYEIEAYLYLSTTTGVYNSDWKRHSTPNFFSINPQIFAFIGLTPWMDFQFIPQVFYNHFQGQDAFNVGDINAGLDFQLLSATAPTWFPGIKLSLMETFPAGKYQNLNPDKKGTQVTGAGAFTTNFNLIFYKVYAITQQRYWSFTLSLSERVSIPVNVQGFSAYGGGYGTHGTIYPGNNFQAIMSFELTLSQNWVLALDNVYNHIARTRFSGENGINRSGAVAIVGLPSSEQFSMAPAIEYNFSANLGIVVGAWVTVTGRNAAEFRDAVIEVVIDF